MNGARKLDPLSRPARNLRIVARCTEPLATAESTSDPLQARSHAGLHLVKSGRMQSSTYRQSDTLEQARRIVSQIEQEIVSRAARDRSVRLRLCTPLPAGEIRSMQKEHSRTSPLHALAVRLHSLFSF